MDLKNFCKENKISQVELAEVFDCGPGNVSNIVNGKRNLTKLQLRLLIEKYGFDVIAKYCDSSEIPSTYVNVSAPVITSNTAPVQAGNNNQMDSHADATLVAVLKQQSEQISTLLAHQERLISLLEKK